MVSDWRSIRYGLGTMVYFFSGFGSLLDVMFDGR